MKENDFKIIKGGTSLQEHETMRSFISAYVTDTRLMGAVVVYIHWKVTENNFKLNRDDIYDFHQYFYYEPEEDGIETYKSLIGNDITVLTGFENSLLGGLGAARLPISEMEARFLVCHYAKTNIANQIPLPDEKKDYDFLLDETVFEKMSDDERNAVIQKTCTPILGDYHSINYFLMRAFAHDNEGLDFLKLKSCNVSDYMDDKIAELCKNNIEIFPESEGISYLCESLVESDDMYRITVSEIKMAEDYKVASAKILSSFNITSTEAALLMAKPEFVTCYDILFFDAKEGEDPHLKFIELFFSFVQGSLATEHEDGSLFILFNENNSHVNSSEFRINDDLRCIYYISNFDQLVVTAYSSKVIHSLEYMLEKSHISKYLLPLCKYQFKEPMVYEFIQSGFEDFEDFVETMLNGDFDD